MAVRYYDDAIVNKIQQWITIPNMKVLGPSDTARLFQMQADIQKDKPLSLPLIALSRDNAVELKYPHRNPQTFDGLMLRAVGDIDEDLKREILENPKKYKGWTIEKGTVKTSYSYQFNVIPMTLKYQLDIYTRYAEEGDELMRNFVFNIVNDPNFKIELPYNNAHFEHYGTLDIDTTVTENSDVPQKMFADQFTRWTIGLAVNDAYLFSVPKYDNVSAEVVGIVLQDDDEEE